MTIHEELLELQSQMAASVTKEPAPIPTTTPIVSPEPVPAGQASNVTPPAVPPVPVTPTTATPAPALPTQPVNVDAVVDNWDADATPAAPATPVATPAASPVTPVSIDIVEVAKALGKDTIDTELMKTLHEKVKAADTLAKLPESLSKAVEIASLGGNYLEYLGVSQVDWNAQDPITLYENYVIDQYTDAQGQTDFEKVDKMLDKIDDDDKELRGRELQRQYINYQAQQKAFYEQQAQANKQNFERQVRQTIDGLKDIAGFTLSPEKKEALYAYVASGQDINQQNLQTRIFNAFVTKYWNALDKFRKTQIKNLATKSLLDEVTVPQITPVGESPSPQNAPKGFSFDEYIKSLEPKIGV